MGRFTSYRLQATSYKLQATSYQLQATSYKLQATSYTFQAELERWLAAPPLEMDVEAAEAALQAAGAAGVAAEVLLRGAAFWNTSRACRRLHL